MSKRINVNPGQYKVAGRERQGDDIVQEPQKQRLAKSREQQVGPGGRTAPGTRSAKKK